MARPQPPASLRTRVRPLTLFLVLVSSRAAAQPDGSPSGEGLTFRYATPAAEWVEALPIGSGRLGADPVALTPLPDDASLLELKAGRAYTFSFR